MFGISRFIPPPRRVTAGVVVTLAGIALGVACLIPFRSDISADAAALVLVIPVVVGVAIGGFVVAPVGIAAGFLAYDFFFILPFHTFRVAKPENLVGLVVYGVVGLVVGGVVAQVQRAQAESARRQAEAEVLYRLSQALAAAPDLRAALHAAVQLIRDLFGFTTAAILLEEQGRRMRIAALDGDELPEPVLRWVVGRGPSGEPSRLAESSVLAVPLVSQTGRPGLLVVAGGNFEEETVRMVTTFATQCALAVERAKFEEEATRSRMLEEVDRLRSALVGAVSHDLRTPLASIKASVSDLIDPAVPLNAEDQATLLRTIEEETDRLARFVSNLLDMSRIEAGALELHRTATPLDEMVAAVIGRMGRLLADHRLTVQVPEDLPLVDVDYILAEQVIANILENAARHTPPGTSIRVTASETLDRWVEVRIADDGPGISEGERDRVFTLFYQPRAERRSRGGTGLGLAICKGVVEVHGGAIWVEPTPGSGATFVVRFPIARAEV